MKKLEERVYRNLTMVPRGKVTTYKELGLSVGMENGQRVIGQIMRKNPRPVIVPCHRVVRSDRSVGGYAYGQKRKIELLMKEGVYIKKGKISQWDRTFHKLK